ncbi:DNA-3-methyladenine glycosylase family protein [Lentzea pudingi]|uniref:DNA-3-methyladenine glycosylase family protein n=1 Tax=Lentzea pudingi TaxID=1789439 RepID=UPI00166E5EF3|nr:DNA-3-methyladenine glycosylase 2 family protein [Lentzea pudingi]
MPSRAWTPPFPLDLGAVLGRLRRGPGDPSFSAEGGVWFAANTPCGPGTVHITRTNGEVLAEAWGEGGPWLLDGLPALLGADDTVDEFVAHHPIIAEARMQRPGLRLGATNRVWDLLFASILEQKVTGVEAFRTWRELGRRFGESAPGPKPLKVPPTPQRLLGLQDWEWHQCGLDGARRRTLINVAQVAHRLEKAAETRSRELLEKVPGVGVWTSAEVAQRAWGDPDAVSVGDYHVAKNVTWALTGKPGDDDAMMELLAPYQPQRHRAVMYLVAAGMRRPRRAPRFSPRDYRRF